MKIKEVSIQNFRSYKEKISFSLDNLTVLVGKNDIGKSTILEALDIFFNDKLATVKIDREDINKQALQEGNNETIISVIFENLPETIIIDDTVSTNFEKEFLLNKDNNLEIIKKFSNAAAPKIFINAYHPTNPLCSDLLLKKHKDLNKIIGDLNITFTGDKRKNSEMRIAIWNHFSEDLQLAETDIDVSKEDAKQIFEKLQLYLPQYSLFQADRKNSDGDNEIQDPLKESVKQIINDPDLLKDLDAIANRIRVKLVEISDLTLEKIQEMDPSIAETLKANIPETQDLKWADVFKNVSITGDHDISINKRGSGVKRLILLNFFRAEAERKRNIEEQTRPIIYAVEEPETSQHFSHQRLLIEAFKKLADDGHQILLTTHSSTIVKALKFKNLRNIQVDGNSKSIVTVEPMCLPYPSLNEVSHAAFGEISEEYHNELYGYIEENEWFSDYCNGKQKQDYIRIKKDGSTTPEQKILTEYIRHQIHHPENKKNTRFTPKQLLESIQAMRDFIYAQK
ncbi:ATP-binding protein [Wohlfahrtiimonas chitiniclastica]|uniref:ATP-binding protein n=1 Tax=Wohlfahrtiimonas chitiniclastica TaxID=400946 RepID=A0AB35BZK1_9GAMM|nr:ATP-binding protein [Wohlfahrtiimonas chitiniclastica]MBS7825109.1 ATP-binding protein [Wohlfahrtiimonas chitiniclastica]MBS7839694.1 ATP-binding protein [Wohlfahrtiimonas chitiniclastica]OYQ74001.1 ATP/GTP-binding protein [Wohlfahrtiimonas chitiniclastica]